MRLDGYIRVSRVAGREGDSFISPDQQRDRIRQWAELHDVEITRWHEDLDQSGGKENRPGLELALRRVQRGRTDGVIVAKLNRLSRRLRGALDIIQKIEDADGQVVSVEEGIDPTTHTGRLMRNLMLSLAEWELGQISEQWKDVTERALNRGAYPAKAPFGYHKCDDGSIEPDPATAPLVKRVFELRRRKLSYGKIADAINEERTDKGAPLAEGRVREILQRRTYLGEARAAFGTEKKKAHKPLISAALFHAVQPDGTHGRNGKLAGVALLDGSLVKCAGCGNGMRINNASTRPPSYVCKPRSAKGRCPAPASATVRDVDNFVLRVIANMPGEGADAQATAEARYADARSAVREAEEVLDDLASPESRQALGRDRWRQATADARRKLDEVNAALDAAEAEIEEPQALDEALDSGSGVRIGDILIPQTWGDMTLEQKRRHIRKYVAEVRVSKAGKQRRWQNPDERIRVRWRGGGFVDAARLYAVIDEAEKFALAADAKPSKQ